MRLSNTILVALTTGTIAACGEQSTPASSPAERPAVKVRLAEVQRVEADALFVGTGSLRGRNTATLTSKTMGHVKSLKVAPGDRFKDGQVLAVLDARDARAGLSGARASVSEAEAARGQAGHQLAAAEAALQLARTTNQRMQRLLAERAVTRQ